MSAMTRILVVDDDAIVRRSHLRSLSAVSGSVEDAWSGDEALRAMERRPFDVVLLDLRMPGTDGMTVLRTIKERWPESEVIVITGYPSVDTAKEAVRLGAYDYLAKPVGPDELVTVASGAMTQKRWSLHPERSPAQDGAGGAGAPRDAGRRPH